MNGPPPKTDEEKEMEEMRKVSPLHASRMMSRKIVNENRKSYREDEKSLKKLRLSIEKTRMDTMEKMDSLLVKSPRHWRDTLINFRIRRKILNRENQLTIK